MSDIKGLILTPGDAADVIARRVRHARKLRKWNQSDLAKRAGVAVNTVARLERSGTAQLATFLRVLSALGHLSDLEGLLRAPKPRTMADLRERNRR
jgi:transcriptional regulator with XRE-family HTH domain